MLVVTIARNLYDGIVAFSAINVIIDAIYYISTHNTQ